MSLNHPARGENVYEIRRRAEFGIGEQVQWKEGCYIFVGQDYEMRVVDIGLDHDHPEGVAHVAGCYLRENLTYYVVARDPNGSTPFKARLYGNQFRLVRHRTQQVCAYCGRDLNEEGMCDSDDCPRQDP